MNVTAHSVTQGLPPKNFVPEERRQLSTEIITLIKFANPLVEVVEELISLRRSGRHLIGKCPLCESKSRAFSLDPEKQLFHCFKCQAGGDVVSFFQQLHRTDFRGAVELLALRAGIEIQGHTISAELAERVRVEKRLRLVEQSIDDILNGEYLHIAREFDRVRGLRRRIETRLHQLHHGAPVRFRGEQELVWAAFADVYAHLRLLDVEFCILAFATKPVRERFLTASSEEKNEMINAVLEDGFVKTERGHPIEVPL